MVRDGPSMGGWKSDAVRRTLDLCLACKGCKHDCPVKVDMATYKAEFFAHYYEGRVRPRAHYSMGLIGLWSRLGMLAPSLANWASRTRPFSDAVRLAGGISRERPMPLFARQRFTDWFRRRSAPINHGATVLLYPDLFNDCFFPGTLKAMAMVLERLGHRVAIPEERVAAIRPLIHYGFLPAAIRELRRTVRMLAPYARAGVPIVCAEPSVISVFRDDLPNLMPGHEDGGRIQKHFRTLPEFLMERTGRDALPHLAGDAVLHIHCHEKALLKPDCQRELLKSLGLKVHEPDPGCCGLAGAFGFEAEHHEVSMRIGEQRLLPAVRASKPYSLVIADGFSCRKQILDGTGRMPLHTAEVLLMALSGDNAAAAEEHPVASTAAVGLGALGAAAGIGALVWALRRASAAR
jgi:Fe-S oxidoreductase